LTLNHLQTFSLGPLQNLWRIGRFEGDEQGVLEITDSGGFADLTGLSSLIDVKSIHIDSTALVSLRGLRLPNSLDELTLRRNLALQDLGDTASLESAQRVVIDGAPQVASLAALGRLVSTHVLTLEELGVQSLDELQALATAGGIDIRDNDRMLDVGRLASVYFHSLTVARNPLLQTLPEFTGQADLQQLQIRENESLTAGPRFPNVATASRIMIAHNPALARIDGFPQLSSLGTLEVRDNSSLIAIELESLAQVNVARIVCNTALAESEITPALSLSNSTRVDIRGNLGSSEPCD
jgi:hypothetical protein